jgi:hypothetical protein
MLLRKRAAILTSGLLQPAPVPQTTAPADSNIVGARVRFTVADTEQTMKVYRDVLQFQPQIGVFTNLPLLDLMGLKGAQLRLTNAQIPGSPLRLEFIELKGTAGTPIRPRLQDPGATRFQVRLRDVDATIGKLRAAGSTRTVSSSCCSRPRRRARPSSGREWPTSARRRGAARS